MMITSARRPLPPGSNSLWILPVSWKTRAIRSAATAPAPKARFPQHLGRRGRRRRLPVGAVGPVRTAGCVVERVERRAVRRGVTLGGGIGGQTRPEGKGRQQQRRRPAALVGPPLGWALPGTNLQSREAEQKDRQADGAGCAGTRQRRAGKDGTGAPVRLAGEDMSVFPSPAESLPGHPCRRRVAISRTSSRPQHWGEGGVLAQLPGIYLVNRVYRPRSLRRRRCRGVKWVVGPCSDLSRRSSFGGRPTR